MNPTLNKETLRKLNPLPPAPALVAPVPHPPDKHVIQISFERELTLPVVVTHQSREMLTNAFRGFGINE